MKQPPLPQADADRIFNNRFREGVQPRSAAYKTGFRYAMFSKPGTPYAIGSAECDAFLAGYEDGRFSRRLDEERRAAELQPDPVHH